MPDDVDIQAGEECVVWADTAGRGGVTPRLDGVSAHDGDGSIRYELRARCVRVLHRLDDPRLPARRLTRLEDPTALRRAAHRHREGIAIVGRDDRGRCGIVRRTFGTADDAASWLEGRRGLYWLMTFGDGWWMPLPDRTDAFAPVTAGSLTVADGHRVFGVLDRLDLAAVDWVFCNGPYAFFVVRILERLAVVAGASDDAPDESPAAVDPHDAQAGDVFVYRRLPDGTTRCVLVTPDESAARTFAETNPGPSLVARWRDQVDTH